MSRTFTLDMTGWTRVKGNLMRWTGQPDTDPDFEGARDVLEVEGFVGDLVVRVGHLDKGEELKEGDKLTDLMFTQEALLTKDDVLVLRHILDGALKAMNAAEEEAQKLDH